MVSRCSSSALAAAEAGVSGCSAVAVLCDGLVSDLGSAGASSLSSSSSSLKRAASANHWSRSRPSVMWRTAAWMRWGASIWSISSSSSSRW